MIEREFVPYQQSVDMKELGFDEPCFGFYNYKGEIRRYTNFDGELNDFQTLKNSEITLGELSFCTLPTYSQAFRWFRENYKLHQNIEQHCGEKFYFNIKDMVHPRRWDEYSAKILETFNESDSQEKAELECLIKLIEIVKSGSLKA